MQFGQMKRQDQRAGHSQHKSGESPPPRGWSSGHWFANGRARRFHTGVHEARIEGAVMCSDQGEKIICALVCALNQPAASVR